MFSQTLDKGGHYIGSCDVGHKDEVDIKEENITNPCYTHHNYQCNDHLYPVSVKHKSYFCVKFTVLTWLYLLLIYFAVSSNACTL